MYTANTMASAIEAMGMSPPGSSAQNAVSRNKMRDCAEAGRLSSTSSRSRFCRATS